MQIYHVKMPIEYLHKRQVTVIKSDNLQMTSQYFFSYIVLNPPINTQNKDILLDIYRIIDNNNKL